MRRAGECVVCVVVLALSPSRAPAQACEDLSCYESFNFPLAKTLPSNAIALEVLGEDLQDVRLVEQTTGMLIPSSIKTLGPDRVWSPDVPVAERTSLELSYRTPCLENTVGLWVDPPASKDKQASLEAVYDADASRVYALVSYEPSTSFDNYLHMEIELDGRPFRAVRYADDYASPTEQFELSANCGQPPPERACDPVGSLVSADRHELIFRTHQLGEKDVEQHALSVDMRCGVEREPPRITRVGDDGCQLGASAGGAWGLLALLFRRRKR